MHKTSIGATTMSTHRHVHRYIYAYKFVVTLPVYHNYIHDLQALNKMIKTFVVNITD